MSCALSTGINNLRSAAGIVSNAQTVANHYVVPYTNPQSIQWDADTETFMDARCNPHLTRYTLLRISCLLTR